MFAASHLAYSSDSVFGFKTREEAWEWITKNFLCDTCKKDLVADFGGLEGRDEKLHPCFTSCGAEWNVDLTEPEEYNLYKHYKDFVEN